MPGFLRVERDQLYVPSLPVGADPWQWDILFSGGPWPDPDYDPTAGTSTCPTSATCPPARWPCACGSWATRTTGTR